ncbi:MAG: hypothetical protein U9P14_09245, partial [Gemmatimonadota bacterium]|nr:hypothetical protein [Gemmatimonadota bacterium]
MACIYPKGSAYKLIRSFSPVFYGVGEFNGREPKDTSRITFIGGSQHAGHIPTDLGYLEDGDRWNFKYTGGTEYLRASTRPEDLAAWPAEFCDENGEPIVISDEDVVVTYTPLGYGAGYNWGAKKELLSYRGYIWLEFQERIMSFSASMARNIQFYDIKMINKSRFHTFQQIGPYDIEDIVAGPGGIFEMGDQKGGQKIAWKESLRFGFTYEEAFSDPAMKGPTPLAGIATLVAFSSLNRETGQVEEADLCSFSGRSESAWGYYFANTVSNPLRYRMEKGEEKYRYLQDPGLNWDNPGGENLLISRGNHDRIYQYYHLPNPLCPDDTTRLVYAMVAAFPSVGDPASMATSPEGLAQVAAELIQNAAMAHNLYESGFAMPRPPVVPNVRLIPGNHQVTITWDNISEFSRDGFYDQYAGQGTDYLEYDFEGYRVYRSTSGEANDAQLLAQFDLKNGIVLETGIMNEKVKILDEDGNEVEEEAVTTTYTHTKGISEYDAAAGARYGLGQDAGLRYSFIDRYEERVEYGLKATNQHRLTNGFRYFYAVTAYDWNGTNKSDLLTMSSLESPLVFSADNMVIPGSNPSSYRRALVTDELSRLTVHDGAGNTLDTKVRDIEVVEGVLSSGALVTNSLTDPFIYVVNPKLIDGDASYFIVIDSIVGEPNAIENPAVTADYDFKLMNRVYVSLVNETGIVLSSDEAMIKCENETFSGHGAHFVLYPAPVFEEGVPFNVEFDIPAWNTDKMVWNGVSVSSGTTPVEDIEIKFEYNSGNNSVPVGWRAADLEIRWQDAGDDSLTVAVWDLTHNVEVPFRRLIGSSWCFVSSWSRFTR